MVLQSVDAGGTWNNVFKTSNNQNIATGYCGANGDLGWTWAGLLFGINVCPKNSSVLLISDFGFVHKTTNAGANWKECYTKIENQNPENNATPKNKDYKSAGDINQVSIWQTYWVDSNIIWQCASDIKAVRTTTKGALWNFNYTGHTENTAYRVAKNISNNTLYMATASIHDLYQSARLTDAILDATNNTGAIKYSTDNGATWLMMHDFSNIVCWVATDPNNANKLYASVVNSTDGNGGIWVTNNANLNAGATWTKLANPPRTEGHPNNIFVLNDGKVVVSFNARRAPGFTTSSGVFLYDATFNTWTDKSDNAMQYWTQDMTIDPNDASQNTWYACVYEGWGNANTQGIGGLYKTTNRGTTWTRIWSSVRCMSATVAPTNANEIYVSTETEGLYYTNNASSATPIFTQTNFPYRNVLRTFFNPFIANEIWVNTFGGGAWASSTIANNINNLKPNFNIAIYPNPASAFLIIDVLANENAFYAYRIFDINGKQIMHNKITSNKTQIDLSAINNGEYLMKLFGKKGSYSKVLSVVK
jgi:photosystem II stability/assembly factor-like uncharacterized protein